MNEEALELFKENYENKGMCKDLPKFKKSFVKKFKKGEDKTIEFYPWAVIERLFKMQGGEIEVVKWVDAVEFENMDYVPDENGELVLKNVQNKALFTHLKATWQGEEEHEHYPIFDNQNAKILKSPNAMNLNTSKQRGMVRLIARISGIGLDIFEKQDGQFDSDEDQEVNVEDKKQEEPQKPKTTKAEGKKSSSTKKKTTKKKDDEKNEAMKSLLEDAEDEKEAEKEKVDVEEAQAEKTEPEDNSFTKAFLDGEDLNEKEQAKAKQKEQEEDFKQEEFGKDSQEYADLLLEVRKAVRDHGIQKEAKAFITQEKEKEMLSELEYSELKELQEVLNKVIADNKG